VICIRATYGDPAGWSPKTRHFRDMATAARAAGFTTIGGFHNLTTGDSASHRRQVDWLRRELDVVPGGAEWAMCDIERYDEMMAENTFPRWSDVLRFQDAWYAVDSRPMVWYLPHWVWERADMGKPDLRALRGPLVASNYGDNDPKAPAALYASVGGNHGPGWAGYGGKSPAIWQFGSRSAVPGASSSTCVDAYRGTLAELITLLTGDDMPLTAGDANVVWYTKNLPSEVPTMTPATALLTAQQNVAKLVDALKDVPADVADLKARPPVKPEDLKAALLDPEVLSAIANAVLDAQAARK
jgi:hypothetical protein